MTFFGIKMATNGLAFASSFPLKLTLNILFVFIATNASPGSNDYLKSSQLRKNSADFEQGNDAFWLSGFGFTPRSQSSKTRKRAKWDLPGEGEDDEENRSKDIADEKSGWLKQMDEISRKEIGKWKKYRSGESESFDSVEIHPSLVENPHRKMKNMMTRKKLGNRTKKTGRKMKGENLKLRENARWRIRGINKPGSRLSPIAESRRMKNARKPKKVKLNPSGISYQVLRRNKYFGKENLGDGELDKLKKLESGRRFDNRLEGIGNGRWGMSRGNEQPSDTKLKILGRKIAEDAGARRFVKNVDERIVEVPEESRKYIWNRRRGGKLGRKPPGKFRADISRNKNIGGIETVEKHSAGPLKSIRGNFVPNSENKYWINDDPEWRLRYLRTRYPADIQHAIFPKLFKKQPKISGVRLAPSYSKICSN